MHKFFILVLKNMKEGLKLYRIFVLLFLTVFFQQIAVAQSINYAENSVLAQGKFVKIKIKESGVYKLTFEDLNGMGITPANVRIFGYGGAMLSQNFSSKKPDDLPEIAIHMEKGSDGIFNSGDYILFYAQGVNSWTYDSSKGMYVHTINTYSNYGYYFVTSDAGSGKKIQKVTVSAPADAVVNNVTEFVDNVVYEKELTNLVNSGKEFYGETFADLLSLNINFNEANTVKNVSSVKVRLDVASYSTSPCDFLLTLHAGQTKTLNVAKKTDNDNYEKGRGANGIYTFIPTSDLLNFNLTYVKSTSASKGYLNYLEVNTRRSLTMAGAVMYIQNPDFLGTDIYSQYLLSTTNSNVQVWDITDQQNITQINSDLNAGQISFISPNNEQKSFIAIDPTSASSFSKPEIVGAVTNQNIHSLPQTDMIIISHPDFVQHAERLAKAHNDKGEITVKVVTTEQVYNEFSSGTPDATAYRWVMKMLYDRAVKLNDNAKKPKYLLLFGRGSFDNRKVIYNSAEGYVLTYQAENSLVETLSYVTDDYFTFLEDSEGSQVPAHTMDLGIGRIPVTTSQEGSDVVNKIIGYMDNTNRGIWKNQLCYLADDGDNALHMKQADSIASGISRSNPSFQITKIYLDAYQQEVNASGETYPVARTQFHSMLRNGMFLLDFVGHAGSTGWTNEQVLSTADVKSLTNTNLPLWMGATCDFLQFDISTVSAGEHVLLNPVGGGIGIISAARPVYASQNMNINKMVNQYLFQKENGKHLRVGDVIMKAKNSLGTEINKLSYVYMGDPALRLNYPDEYQIVTTKVNSVPVTGNDTLRALSVATIEGYIANSQGTQSTDFNGYLYLNVFDKIQKITTLNNDKNGSLIYYDRPNMLFSGMAEVKDGKYSVTFMLPRDIKYNYGSGRINLYAFNDSTGAEAQGIFENFTIGGSNQNFVYETDGPQISMFLNTTDFKEGGQVNETPVLIAEMSDVNGINQVGSGIGHDMVLTVDEDPGQSYILNEYYKTALNDFSKGSLKFKLPTLKSGKHTLTFRVWDLLNNSGSKTIEFEVVKGLAPVIFNISNYPNPVKSYTKFVINHDRPETVINAQVDIFDMSGRKVWSFSQSTLDEITWYLSDSAGNRLKSGVYLYRISIKNNSNEVYSKINKMLLIEE